LLIKSIAYEFLYVLILNPPKVLLYLGNITFLITNCTVPAEFNIRFLKLNKFPDEMTKLVA